MRAASTAPTATRGGARLDDIDLRLIALLRKDGRAANRDLGQALGISEGTVRSRIKRLGDARIMRVTAITDFEAEGNEFWVMCCFQVEGRPVKEVAADIARFPQAIAVSIVSGRFDILATVLTRDKAELVHLLSEGLGKIEGISAIENSVALEVVLSRSEWTPHL